MLSIEIIIYKEIRNGNGHLIIFSKLSLYYQSFIKEYTLTTYKQENNLHAKQNIQSAVFFMALSGNKAQRCTVTKKRGSTMILW